MFRKWATQLLKDYLIKAYVINQEKLKEQSEKLNELKQTIKILGNALEYKELSNDESRGLIKIISDYSEPQIIYDFFYNFAK